MVIIVNIIATCKLEFC